MDNIVKQFAGPVSFTTPEAEKIAIVISFTVFAASILLTLFVKTKRRKALILVGGLVLAVIVFVVALGVISWRTT